MFILKDFFAQTEGIKMPWLIPEKGGLL